MSISRSRFFTAILCLSSRINNGDSVDGRLFDCLVRSVIERSNGWNKRRVSEELLNGGGNEIGLHSHHHTIGVRVHEKTGFRRRLISKAVGERFFTKKEFSSSNVSSRK